MITTAIFPGRYVQGAGALRTLCEQVDLLGSNALVLCDEFSFKNLDEILRLSFDGGQASFETERFGGECSDPEIDRVSDIAKQIRADVIVGLGGGKVLDTAKAVAFRMSLRCISAPTIASTDAPCSALSVIYHPDGKFNRYEVLPYNPDIVLVDTSICANAPTRYIVAGMGDALATWYEAEDCRIKRGTNMTGRQGPLSAYGLARLCKDTLLEYGALAKTCCDENLVTPAVEHVVEANTLLSGLGFESGGLAAAHALHNGLTILPETHSYYHGEKVAIGLQAMMFLSDRPMSIIHEIFEFCESIGLPTTLADIGIERIDTSRLREACIAACAPGETIHNEPHEVTPERVLDAVLAADALGRQRRRSTPTYTKPFSQRSAA